MPTIPVLLLKTPSAPRDAYEECFSSYRDNGQSISEDNPVLRPIFVPILEHQSNAQSLDELKSILRDRSVADRYGGLIFTSQRAVEALAQAFAELGSKGSNGINDSPPAHASSASSQAPPSEPHERFPIRPTTFPLYAVGPATTRLLTHVLSTSPSSPALTHFLSLHPQILGSHTGSGPKLAAYILKHYNALHSGFLFEFYEAPRLPFIPLLGAGSEQYVRRGRKRLELDDPKLRKRPLLFLAGEVRRDVVPVSLRQGHVAEQERPPSQQLTTTNTAIEVTELEIYSTTTHPSFPGTLTQHLQTLRPSHRPIILVLFSPTGAELALRATGLLPDSTNTNTTTNPSASNPADAHPVLATIGPTTRDFIHDKFGISVPICATSPTPEGLLHSIVAYLKSMDSVESGVGGIKV